MEKFKNYLQTIQHIIYNYVFVTVNFEINVNHLYRNRSQDKNDKR